MIFSDFIYDGKQLSDQGYVTCRFGNASEDTTIGATIAFNTVNAANRDRHLNVSYEWSDYLTLTFDIMKYNFTTCQAETMDMDDVEFMLFWLNSTRSRTFQMAGDCKGYENILYPGSFTSINLVERNTEIWGLNVTFTCDLPYGLSEIQTFSFSLEPQDTFEIENISTRNGYIYPKKVDIMTLEEGDFQLLNKLSDKMTEIKNCGLYETITMNGDIMFIETDNPDHNIADDFNYEFVRLYRNDKSNVNHFEVNMACEITMDVQFVRKVGMA